MILSTMFISMVTFKSWVIFFCRIFRFENSMAFIHICFTLYFESTGTDILECMTRKICFYTLFLFCFCCLIKAIDIFLLFFLFKLHLHYRLFDPLVSLHFFSASKPIDVNALCFPHRWRKLWANAMVQRLPLLSPQHN